MLVGEYIKRVEGQYRVVVPSKLRTELDKPLYVTRGYENSIVLLDTKLWQNFASVVEKGSFINNLVRDTARFIIGGASEVVPDKQGRIKLPTNLVQYADIKAGEQVVFIGLIKWVEIWSYNKWQERVKFLEKNGVKIAEKLDKLLN